MLDPKLSAIISEFSKTSKRLIEVMGLSIRAFLLVLAFTTFGFSTNSVAGHSGGRDYVQADRLIAEMERAIFCIAAEYPREIRGIRPTNDQRAFDSATKILKHAAKRLRSAFEDGRYNRVSYEFNQLENRFKSANRYKDRARVSPSIRCHLETTQDAIASFKRLKSNQYGLKD